MLRVPGSLRHLQFRPRLLDPQTVNRGIEGEHHLTPLDLAVFCHINGLNTPRYGAADVHHAGADDRILRRGI
ncbi:hypothetical protein D3C77_594230 [compost metagenome]